MLEQSHPRRLPLYRCWGDDVRFQKDRQVCQPNLEGTGEITLRRLVKEAHTGLPASRRVC